MKKLLFIFLLISGIVKGQNIECTAWANVVQVDDSIQITLMAVPTSLWPRNGNYMTFSLSINKILKPTPQLNKSNVVFNKNSPDPNHDLYIYKFKAVIGKYEIHIIDCNYNSFSFAFSVDSLPTTTAIETPTTAPDKEFTFYSILGTNKTTCKFTDLPSGLFVCDRVKYLKE